MLGYCCTLPFGLPPGDRLKHAAWSQLLSTPRTGWGGRWWPRWATDLFQSIFTSLWEGGWQPAEVIRVLRRSRRADYADLAVTAFGGDGDLR
jgi:hypothetical protein